MSPITFAGAGSQWPPSAKLRADYAAAGRPIILSFSRGKDSLAAWLAMLDSGIPPDLIYPVYYERVPGLPFSERSVQDMENWFDRPILRLPHPSLYSQWNQGVFQSPTRTGLVRATDMPNVTYQDLEEQIRAHHGLPEDTHVATGVRAADGISRRTYLKVSGPYAALKQRVAIIWDWTKGECYDRITEAGVPLPVDYTWFAQPGRARSGRTFDGLSYQFLRPIRDNSPEDWAYLTEWFPLIELEIIRHERLA